MMVDNRAGIKVTFSVPEDDVQDVRQILAFCKKHGVPYSPILVKRLKEWYDKNQAIIQEVFYNNDSKVKSQSPA